MATAANPRRKRAAKHTHQPALDQPGKQGQQESTLEGSGEWVFLAPVRYLEVTREVDFEFRIDRCTVIAAARLAYRRKRFGLPRPLNELQRLSEFFSKSSTFVVFMFSGKQLEETQRALTAVRDELAILALSQLSYTSRDWVAFPAIDEKSREVLSFLMLNTSDVTWRQRDEISSRHHTLVLNKTWNNFQKHSFFFALLRILTGKAKVHPSWRQTLRDAAVLAGQALCSTDLPHSFLWNMIALETLLTEQGDKYTEKLPERVEAFIGWASEWTTENYAERIRVSYSKRCDLVHRGIRNAIGASDVKFTEDLLLNVFSNLVRHPKLFGSKEKVIEFSKRLAAERLLGIRGRVRPKSLHFLERT
jgi:hypothetical protein